MLNAFGGVFNQTDGRYKGQSHTINRKADNDILPNIQKNSGSRSDFRLLTEGVEIGAGWTRKSNILGMKR